MTFSNKIKKTLPNSIEFEQYKSNFKKMNSLPLIEESVSLYVNRNENTGKDENDNKKVLSLYKNKIEYASLPLPEKWKYRKAVNDLQVLINKIQSEELSSLDNFDFNLPEVVNLLKIRKEMLSYK